ncbi:hypothetical protein AB0D54_16530 [Streptomyces xanthophaeus]|uniref:hypothetical protein n=1 Tax=Streptomyces xanthophaeus TaxID=67385 RepID=UPI00342EDC56
MRTGSRTAALLALCCTATAAAGLTGCGGPPRDGYVAVGAAAPGPERGAGENVAPQGPVELQQLGGPSAAGGSSTSAEAPPGPTDGAQAGTPAGPPSGGSPGAPGSSAPGGSAAAPGTPQGPGRGTGGSGGTGSSGGSGGSGGSVTPGASGGPGTPGTPSAPGTPSNPPATRPGTTPPAPPPATPARLTLSTPVRSAAADRWCELVTVTFTNTGTTAARSGTVSFATHIIGALGVDWATITTTQPLPAPVPGAGAKTHTYTVCVEAWRVPLGMHVETRKVTAAWS